MTDTGKTPSFPPYWQQMGYESPEACRTAGLDPDFVTYAELEARANGSKPPAAKKRRQKSAEVVDFSLAADPLKPRINPEWHYELQHGDNGPRANEYNA